MTLHKPETPPASFATLADDLQQLEADSIEVTVVEVPAPSAPLPKPRPKPPAAGRGRKPGERNKVTTALREAILVAAADIGEDGQGEGRLVGYLRHLARREPRAYAGLLGKVLPLQVALEGKGASNGPLVIVTGVPRPGEDATALQPPAQEDGEPDE